MVRRRADNRDAAAKLVQSPPVLAGGRLRQPLALELPKEVIRALNDGGRAIARIGTVLRLLSSFPSLRRR